MDFKYSHTLYFRRLAPEKISITAIAVAQTRQIIFAGMSNGTVIAWDMYLSVPVARICIVEAHEGEITSIIYDEDTQLLVTGGTDHQVKIWDPVFADLVDVSLVERPVIEAELKQDAFYVRHRGTVMPPILPSDLTMKKTVLVQQLCDSQRGITHLTIINNTIIALSRDGNAYMYVKHADPTLKYPEWRLEDRFFMGYEASDVSRQAEVMRLSTSNTEIYGKTQSLNLQVTQTKHGHSINTDDKNLLSVSVFPSCAVSNKDDGSIYVGDSTGSVHVFDVNHQRLRYQRCYRGANRLGISNLAFLEKENTVVTAGFDGVVRGLAGMTGQSAFTFFNQRSAKFRSSDVINIESAEQKEGGVKKYDSMIILVDETQSVTVLEASHGQLAKDFVFTDLLPTQLSTQQDLEKYNVDTTLPIVCDFRQSKNHGLYSIQKLNTSASDEYRMLKLAYQKKMSQDQLEIAHPNLQQYSEPCLRMINKITLNGEQYILFVRDVCVNVFKLQRNMNDKAVKATKPVKLLGIMMNAVETSSKKDNEKIDEGNEIPFDLQVFKSRSTNFSRFMNKYRVAKVSGMKINAPLSKLAALTPYFPEDLDAIESLVRNNLDEAGELPTLPSPTRKGVMQTVSDMTVPFYIITATEDNDVQNYDPRVMRRPYHVYHTDFHIIMSAVQLDVGDRTGITSGYKKLEIVDNIQLIKPPNSFLDKGQLPKIQPVLRQDNIYAKLAKPKQAVYNINVKKENQLAFYHTSTGFDNQHNLGLNDADITYTVQEDPETLKTDILKMNLEVKTVSQLPGTSAFSLLTDPTRRHDVLVYGHEDGSLTFQELLSNAIVRVFGGHKMAAARVASSTAAAGYNVVSQSSDGRFLVLQVSREGLKVAYLCHSQYTGDGVTALVTTSNFVLFGTTAGHVFLALLPFQPEMKAHKVFDGPMFFDYARQTGDAGGVFDLFVNESCLTVVFDNGSAVEVGGVVEAVTTFQEQQQKQQTIEMPTNDTKFATYAAVVKEAAAKSGELPYSFLPSAFYQLLKQGERLQSVYIACPLHRAAVEIGKKPADRPNLRSELVDEQNRIAAQRIKTVESRTMKAPTAKLRQILNPTEGMVVKTDVGTRRYIIAGIDTKLVVFYKGESIHEQGLESPVVVLQSVQRGLEGDKILSQLAQGTSGQLLQTVWAGLENGRVVGISVNWE